MPFSIRSFISASGERFSLMFDNCSADRFPMFYVTAYISRVVRLKCSHSTQIVHLEAIKRVYEWEATREFCLEERFQKLNFLRAAEIDSLISHLRKARLGSPGEVISSEKSNTYVVYASNFLNWLAREVISESNRPDILQALDAQANIFKQSIRRKTGSNARSAQQILAKKLSDAARAQLLELFQSPLVGVYRESDKACRARNVLMLRLLYETGIRRGELLSLKLKNYREGAGRPNASLVIERNHDDEFDRRIHQPVAKTAGRIVPISEGAEQQLIQYIEKFRAEVPNVGFTDESFIFINHRRGNNQGGPISISTFAQAIINIRSAFPALREANAHLLRHDWNYRFSKIATAQNLDAKEEWERRAVLMGWTRKSEMEVVYNQRHVQEQAASTGLMIARDTRKRIS